MPLTHFFEEIGLADRLTVGGKGANLGELVRAQIPVPPGFVVGTESFAQFLDCLDLDYRLRGRLEQMDADDLSGIAQSGQEMRALIQTAELPAGVAAAIAHSHATLCGDRQVPVAVRSSATGEDAEDASFAGLQDTYLWLRDAAAVAHHVRACWASLYNNESLCYRRRLGIGERGIAMAVVVQRMVDSRASGVMFTRSPLTGDRSVIVIEGSYGLGSCIVSGEVTPDKFVINKVTGEITDRTISRKTRQHLPDRERGGVCECAVEEARQHASCISDDELRMLGEIARRVERHYGRPQDIEWAVSRDGDILLLQSRPETVWSRRDAAPVAAPKANPLEHVFAVFGKRQ